LSLTAEFSENLSFDRGGDCTVVGGGAIEIFVLLQRMEFPRGFHGYLLLGPDARQYFIKRAGNEGMG